MGAIEGSNQLTIDKGNAFTVQGKNKVILKTPQFIIVSSMDLSNKYDAILQDYYYF